MPAISLAVVSLMARPNEQGRVMGCSEGGPGLEKGSLSGFCRASWGLRALGHTLLFSECPCVGCRAWEEVGPRTGRPTGQDT